MTMTVSPIVPASTALLLMDFQPAMLASVPDPDTLLARTRAALSWARSQQVQVCYVRVAFTDEDFRAVPAHSKAFGPVAQNKFLAADGPRRRFTSRWRSATRTSWCARPGSARSAPPACTPACAPGASTPWS